MSVALKSIVGARLRELRHNRGLTQEQLAEQLGVTPRYLAGIERGERNLSLDTLDALAKGLGVESRSLLIHEPVSS
ncbi:MAG: helix-turn-helix transcriptional regulator [Kocuria sp.]|uniref:helix-turn-helix domain-containing protein n=1 Tax=Kocuria sp. TaxID=1871328 RepID=UPI0026DB6E90|nr:helix-turn-helix transcriptional regulator [Kocuria sp.]MDO4256347.1 helix-turn-helix transcriptional regulator [Kocuria sp.]